MRRAGSGPYEGRSEPSESRSARVKAKAPSVSVVWSELSAECGARADRGGPRDKSHSIIRPCVAYCVVKPCQVRARRPGRCQRVDGNREARCGPGGVLKPLMLACVMMPSHPGPCYPLPPARGGRGRRRVCDGCAAPCSPALLAGFQWWVLQGWCPPEQSLCI